MEYVLLSYDEIENPVEEGLYEYDSDENEYYLSEDEIVVSGTNYYLGIEDDEEEDPSLYELVEPDEYENPSSDHLYEYDAEAEEYVPSSDTTIVSGKDYYIYYGDLIEYDDDDQYYPIDVDDEDNPVVNPAEEGLYVYEDGFYVLTEDTTVQDGTEYFRLASEEMETDEELDFVYELVDLQVEDVGDPLLANLYEYVDYEYIPTADREVVSGKEYYRFIGDDDDLDLDMALVPTPETEEVVESDANLQDNDYVIAYTVYVSNPKSFGYYEYVNDAFVLTQDEQIVPGKVYYEHVEMSDYREFSVPEGSSPRLFDVFEKQGNDYVLTEDEQIVSGKKYYVYDPIFPEYVEFDSFITDDMRVSATFADPVEQEE